MLSYAEYVEKIKKDINEVTPQWLVETGFDNVIIIDVRDHAELAEGQIPEAIHVSRGMLEAKITSLPQFKSKSSINVYNEEIVLYCQSGARSALSAKSLEDMGFKNVKSLCGGFQNWKENNHPID